MRAGYATRATGSNGWTLRCICYADEITSVVSSARAGNGGVFAGSAVFLITAQLAHSLK
jgi:hypothetical protein